MTSTHERERSSAFRGDAPTAWLAGAAIAGLLHAAFSAYWAAGGTWLLRTVGEWAVDLSDTHPGRAAAVLGLVAAAKAVVAVAPLYVARARSSFPRLLRRGLWVVACGLVVYGGVNTVVAQLVLLGPLAPEGGYDTQAMRGHAFLWDPLLLVWGAVLARGLWLLRDERGVVQDRRQLG